MLLSEDLASMHSVVLVCSCMSLNLQELEPGLYSLHIPEQPSSDASAPLHTELLHHTWQDPQLCSIRDLQRPSHLIHPTAGKAVACQGACTEALDTNVPMDEAVPEHSSWATAADASQRTPKKSSEAFAGGVDWTSRDLVSSPTSIAQANSVLAISQDATAVIPTAASPVKANAVSSSSSNADNKANAVQLCHPAAAAQQAQQFENAVQLMLAALRCSVAVRCQCIDDHSQQHELLHHLPNGVAAHVPSSAQGQHFDTQQGSDTDQQHSSNRQEKQHFDTQQAWAKPQRGVPAQQQQQQQHDAQQALLAYQRGDAPGLQHPAQHTPSTRQQLQHQRSPQQQEKHQHQQPPSHQGQPVHAHAHQQPAPPAARLEQPSAHLQPAPAHLQPAPARLHPAPAHLQPAPAHLQPAPAHVHPAPAHLQPAPVLILFSGGVDSTLIAALAHESLPEQVPIDLASVCFNGGKSADRLAALDAAQELAAFAPDREWRLIEVDSSLAQVDQHREWLLGEACCLCTAWY